MKAVLARTLWQTLTWSATPFLPLWLALRKRNGKEDRRPERFAERFGYPSQPRPTSGSVIWVHAASAGESLSVLGLLSILRTRIPDLTVVLTTGTVSSAELIAKRAPEGVVHQYIPLDHPLYIKRFLNHWRPDGILWVESELWPNLLHHIRQTDVPAVILNGRMSPRSFRRWNQIPAVAQDILSTFDFIFAQSDEDAAHFRLLGAPEVVCVGNLKYATHAPPVDHAALDALRRDLGKRKTWLMASTHPGEEAIAGDVHQYLAQTWSDIVTVIAPRHPARATEIKAILTAKGLRVAQRSQNEPLTTNTNIYLADTMGEMGTLYTLTPVACVAGSFTWGGHNPIEPAQLGASAVLYGPKMTNFLAIAASMNAADAALQVADAQELAKSVHDLLNDPKRIDDLRRRAHEWAQEMAGSADRVMAYLESRFIVLIAGESPAHAESD